MRCNQLQPAHTSSCHDPVNTDTHLQETFTAFSRPDEGKAGHSMEVCLGRGHDAPEAFRICLVTGDREDLCWSSQPSGEA